MLPLEEQKLSVSLWRQIGLGIFGLSDMLIKLGLRYGSDDAISFCDNVFFNLADEAIYQSSLLAQKDGAFDGMSYIDEIVNSEFFKNNTTKRTLESVKKYGLRNSQLLTIAPTGTISNMLGVSNGAEPIFSFSYKRKTETLHSEGEVWYDMYTKIVKDYMDMHELKNDNYLPDYFVTTHKLHYKDRIKMQAMLQRHIDASISSTVNLPKNTSIDDVYDLYVYAWTNGLKGITVYRDGCERTGVLTTSTTTPTPNTVLERGDIIQIDEDVIGRKRDLITGCGTLHCSAFFDPATGDALETYLNKGSTGGCNSFMEAVSRLMSYTLRVGGTVDGIVDQLGSCSNCCSYVVRTATKKDTSRGTSCPAALGYALKDMYNQVQYELGNIDEFDEKPIIFQPTSKVAQTTSTAKCPECGAALAFEGGCNSCKNCGYSKCE